MGRTRHKQRFREEHEEHREHDQAACVMCGASAALVTRTEFDGFLICVDCLGQIDDDSFDAEYADTYDDLQFMSRRRTF